MNLEEKEAKFGEKMIEVKVRFWTDKIASGKSSIKLKHCWDAGAVRISANKSHGIKAQKPIIFNSLLEISRAIEECLIKNKISVHTENRSYKYMRLYE